MKINRDELLWAFLHAGWLDVQTGDIATCKHMRQRENGIWIFDLPGYIANAPERYIRVPFFDQLQVALDFLNVTDIPSDQLSRYGIGGIDYSNDTYVLHTTHDGIKGIKDAEFRAFLSRFQCMLEEDPKLEDRFIEYFIPVRLQIVRKWAETQGFECD